MNISQPGNVVAVAPTVDPHPNGPRFRLNAAYIDALESCGLIPIVVPPLADSANAGAILEGASGLLLTGGVDIDPSLYGEERGAHTQLPSGVRDTWEIALTAAARERALPTLAICRGMQLVNVALGGTLMQDIASQRPGSLRHDYGDERKARVHEVEVQSRARLAKLLGTTTLQVNSMHHQGIGELASRLQVAALAPDGMIEALEWAGDDWWMVAVQWHPEELVHDKEPWDRNLFHAFAAEARRSRG
jgi:putative glutamine amidotransferase